MPFKKVMVKEKKCICCKKRYLSNLQKLDEQLYKVRIEVFIHELFGKTVMKATKLLVSKIHCSQGFDSERLPDWLDGYSETHRID